MMYTGQEEPDDSPLPPEATTPAPQPSNPLVQPAPKDYGKQEPDDSPTPGDVKPMVPRQSEIMPNVGMPKTNEALGLLGAGQPYMNRNQ